MNIVQICPIMGLARGLTLPLDFLCAEMSCEERTAQGLREINVDTLVSTLTRRGRH